MAEAVLLVGTKKGLWIGRSDASRQEWEWSEPRVPDAGHLRHLHRHPRRSARGCSSAAPASTGDRASTGPTTLVRTWTETQGAAVRFPEDLGSSVERVWQIQPGGAGRARRRLRRDPAVRAVPLRRRRRVVQPGPLARGTTRTGPSGAPASAARPSITSCRTPPIRHRVTVAMSTGGVYRTVRRRQDAGTRPTRGIKAYFFPDPWPEFGQCVHKVAAHPPAPERMFAQNHHGVYRSDDGGDHWVSIADGLPADFGFPIVVHPHRPGDRLRLPAGGRRRADPAEGSGAGLALRRCGGDLEASAAGLPDGFFAAVMRDAMSADNGEQTGLYLGARDGTVFASTDDGETWSADRRSPARCALRPGGGDLSRKLSVAGATMTESG